LATVYEDDQEKNQASQQNPLGAGQNPLTQDSGQYEGPSTGGGAGSGQQISSGEAGKVGAGGVQATPNVDQSKRSSGSFTNLQKFIDANKKADLGGRVAGKIGEETTKANTGLQTQKDQFGNALTGAQTEQESVFGTASQELDKVKEQTLDSQQLDLNAAQQNIESATNYQYGGPDELGGQDELASQNQRLQSVGNSTQTEEGRFGLLQDYFSKPSYNRGQQKLDQLLLQSDPNAVGKLNEASKDALGFQDTFNTTVGNSRNQVQDFLRQFGEDKTKLGADISGAQTELNTFLGDKVSAENIERAKMTGQITPEEASQALAKLGYKTNKAGRFNTGIEGLQLNVSDLIAQGKIKGSSNTANMQNYDTDTLERLNLLSRLTGNKELNPSAQLGAGYGNTAKSFQSDIDKLKQQLASTKYGNVTDDVMLKNAADFSTSKVATERNIGAMDHVINHDRAFIKAVKSGKEYDTNLVKSFMTGTELSDFNNALANINKQMNAKRPNMFGGTSGPSQHELSNLQAQKQSLLGSAAKQAVAEAQKYKAQVQKIAAREALINSFKGKY